tara:strand:+ start:37356 stop:38486 length:1131 start_codon:yes stop_codon:yes gene_type:complete
MISGPHARALRTSLILPGLLASALLAGCSDSSDNSSTAPPAATPFQEIYDQGVIRYLGEYTPMLSEADGDIVNHSFGAGDGPLCLNGSEYSMATRDAGAEELVIFLEGGGACWSEFCAATTEVTPGMPSAGLLDPTRANNPVKDWNVAYVPYCDGGIHGSDKDTDTDGDGQADLLQRGLHNLSAALDVAVATFPAPTRILLTGQSAGGLGTTLALPLVRYLYPDVPIEIVNDSGVGIARPDQPEFVELLISDWNFGAFFPESCTDCISPDGHLSNYHIWQLDQDPTLRRSMLSYTRDTVFADVFLMIGKDAFEEILPVQMQKLEDAHPDRMRSWVPAGAGHTFLVAEPDQTAGGVPLMDFIAAMLNGSGDWVSVSD